MKPIPPYKRNPALDNVDEKRAAYVFGGAELSSEINKKNDKPKHKTTYKSKKKKGPICTKVYDKDLKEFLEQLSRATGGIADSSMYKTAITSWGWINYGIRVILPGE